MSRFNKFLSLLLLGFCTLIPVHSSAEIQNFSSAINIAGRQRMLSQRIVATYSQIGQKIREKKSKQQLKDAINLFDQQLDELKTYQPTGNINRQLEKVTQLWYPMRLIATKPIQRDKAEALKNLSDDVLKASNQVVVMLQEKYNSQVGNLVNISGRQRMLSQRMSSLYMLQSWGFSNIEYSNDYSQTINEFKQALSILNKSKLNTRKINKKLNKVRKEFAMFEMSSHKNNGKFIPLLVKMSADKLLNIMNDITLLYEQLE